MTAIRARQFLVSGRVQGVSFRAHTRAQALALSLSGYARNLANGQVEVLAIGLEPALVALEAWLWRGPILARVDAVSLTLDRAASDLEASAPVGFSIR